MILTDNKSIQKRVEEANKIMSKFSGVYSRSTGHNKTFSFPFNYETDTTVYGEVILIQAIEKTKYEEKAIVVEMYNGQISQFMFDCLEDALGHAEVL